MQAAIVVKQIGGPSGEPVSRSHEGRRQVLYLLALPAMRAGANLPHRHPGGGREESDAARGWERGRGAEKKRKRHIDLRRKRGGARTRRESEADAAERKTRSRTRTTTRKDATTRSERPKLELNPPESSRHRSSFGRLRLKDYRSRRLHWICSPGRQRPPPRNEVDQSGKRARVLRDPPRNCI